MVQKLLTQHGVEFRLRERAVRALFQPVTGRLERLASQEPGPLGLESRQRYVYIGPLEPELREDDTLTVAGKGYIVRTAQRVPGSGGPVYTWAMCVEKGREDPWGMNS